MYQYRITAAVYRAECIKKWEYQRGMNMFVVERAAEEEQQSVL